MTKECNPAQRAEAFAWAAVRRAAANGNYTRVPNGAAELAKFAKSVGQLLEARGHLDRSFGPDGSLEAELAANGVAAYDGAFETTPEAVLVRATELAESLVVSGKAKADRLRSRAEAEEFAAKAALDEKERAENAARARREEFERTCASLGLQGKEVLQ